MNNLSWLLYFLGVYDNVRELLFGMVFFGCIGLVVTGVFGGMVAMHEDAETAAPLLKWFKRFAIAMCIVIPIQVALPNEKIVYAIVASEVGEEVLKHQDLSPELAKARAVLNKKMDDMLKDEKND